jgi:ferredoxin
MERPMASDDTQGKGHRIVLCSCDDTMKIDPARVGRGCGGSRILTARQLCGQEIERFKAIAAEPGPVTICCTQQAPLFAEVAEDESAPAALTFVNVRETGGWSSEGDQAAPKMAALVAAARIAAREPAGVTLESHGVTLVYGRGQTALDAAARLAERLDVTLLLSEAADAVPPSRVEFPIRLGRIRAAKGHLGAFELMVDGFAAPAPSSRRAFVFGKSRDGAVSKADLVIDLSGRAPLFASGDLRDGYLRADPGDASAVQTLIAKAADLVGTFDKPRYVNFRAELCAHARSKKVGCRRCLDLCPAGAITPAGDAVAIDPCVCGGCGQCAAACPTGAASYALPATDTIVQRLGAMMGAYRAAGGTDAIILVHDADHGEALIDAAARFAEGLPARVIPLLVNEAGQLGLEAVAAAFAYGAAGLRVLTRSKPRHGTQGLEQTLAVARAVLEAQGFGSDCVGLIATDDPDPLIEALRSVRGVATAKPATFLALGGKRDVLKMALRELNRAAPAPVEVVALPAGAVFGGLDIDAAGCTLCLSCVAACPTGALSDQSDRPVLRFDESLCVQCGLCAGTCPERVIALVPRLDFNAFERPAIVVKEEEPFCCTTCGKAFGVKSTIERVKAKLAGQHWMFSGEQQKRLELIGMCEDCRVETAFNEQVDPYGAPPRPKVRTTDDYLAERQAREAEMLEKIKSGDA